MGMWPAIQSLLTSSTSTDGIRSAALWIVGTAAQNNPSAQNAVSTKSSNTVSNYIDNVQYLSLPNSPIRRVLSLLSSNESSSATRSKAVYALSGLLKHNARGVTLLEENGGWQILKDALGGEQVLSLFEDHINSTTTRPSPDPDITVRRKVVFLLNALLISTDSSTTTSQPSSARLHGGGVSEPSTESQAAHPNSHASMTVESAATAPIALRALHDHDFIPNLVQGLVNPIPHGANGDQEGDADFEEKLIRLLHTYFTSFSGSGAIRDDEKTELRAWIEKRSREGEQWDLGKEELQSLQSALT